MSREPRVLAIVPARGGSKGVPRKNLQPLAGKPLIQLALECARGSTSVTQVVLSSDDAEILEVGTSLGFDRCIERNPVLAKDDTPMLDVVADVLAREPGFDIAVLLQPTCPLRRSEDVDVALRKIKGGAPACVSVTRAENHPYWTYFVDGDDTLRAVDPDGATFTRRQDLPDVGVLNGAVYAARVGWLLEHRSFVGPGTVAMWMPKERSIDIDTEADLAAAKAALE